MIQQNTRCNHVHQPNSFGISYNIFMQRKEHKKLKQVTTYILKNPTKVSSFSLIVNN
jgi:hypothetical protein